VTRAPRSVADSVRARLQRLHKGLGGDFQLLLLRYANERWLYRLARSEHAGAFVLKGAALFTLWTGAPHRATRDLDLLGAGTSNAERIQAIFAEVIALEVPDDGLAFEPASLSVAPIREEQEYGGLRASFLARLGKARVHLQVDVGFGDAITPEAAWTEFPVLLDQPAPRLKVYPRETVVAEKLEAIVQLDIENSRMKDFYDLMLLSRSFAFDGPLLVRAIRATFERRKTPLPTQLPIGLRPEFASNAMKQEQWAGFVRKSGAANAGDLPSAVEAVSDFLGRPLLDAAAHDSAWEAQWPAGGPWSPIGARAR
jgi:hypothetical protein